MGQAGEYEARPQVKCNKLNQQTLLSKNFCICCLLVVTLPGLWGCVCEKKFTKYATSWIGLCPDRHYLLQRPCLQPHACGCNHSKVYGIQPHHLTLSVTLLKLLIFNHIDLVSHYFHKIWPLYTDDMNSILKWNYYLSFETSFSRFAMAKVIMILIACNA